jgi:hypothetical protein
MRATEFLAEASPEELQEALENWMEMYSTPHDIQTILLSKESKPFKKPPNVQWLYRAIVLKNRNINNIKSTSQVIAFATDIKGAVTFVRSLDVYGDWVIIRKPFNPADFLLDFTSMYEAIAQGAHHYGYVSEHEVWMKPTPEYIGAKKSEIVLTSQDYYARPYYYNRLSEARVIDPDVSWVEPILGNVNWEDAGGDVDALADILTRAFAEHDIAFEPAERGNIDYGTGVFADRTARRVGIPGAEFNGEDPLMVVYITQKTARFPTVTPDIVNVIRDLIKHELIHVEQNRLSQGRLGFSHEGDRYYKDPQEIGAIASEMESQLLRIQPNINKLLQMIQSGDRRLEKSDRYRLYKQSALQDPRFRSAYNRIIKSVINRLTHNQGTQNG